MADSPKMQELLSRLHIDAAFRQEFANSPRNVLKHYGFDPDMLALPSHIDVHGLEQRLAQIFGGTTTAPAVDPAHVVKMSPDELWKQFGVIGLDPDAQALVSGDGAGASVMGAPVVAVVIYGVSMVTSGGGVVGNQAAVASLDQIKALRTLSSHPPDALRFSVTGPDGTTVKDVGTDTIRAFLTRLSSPS